MSTVNGRLKRIEGLISEQGPAFASQWQLVRAAIEDALACHPEAAAAFVAVLAQECDRLKRLSHMSGRGVLRSVDWRAFRLRLMEEVFDPLGWPALEGVVEALRALEDQADAA